MMTAQTYSGAKSSADASARVDGATAAFGMSAVVAILFNTALAWIKDSSPALNSLMAHLTGHHWRTHGLLDLAVFVVLGAVLMSRHYTIRGATLAFALAASVIVAGGGLALWFVLM